MFPEMVLAYVRELAKETIIVTGGARGVDTWAETAARQKGLAVELFIPEWDKLGRGAGMIRNQKIVDACDRLVAFWDGKSRGTKDSIEKARRAGKQVDIYRE